MASTKVDCSIEFDTEAIRGKTAIVTGGAQGIGEAYARALANAGAFVVIGDIDVDRGEQLCSEFPSQFHLVKCDVTNWADQLALFRAATSFSPTNLIHAVIANAGITEPDAIFSTAETEPSEPSLKMLDVNYKGTLYTTKLALHHFRTQHAANPSLQTSLVLQSSIAAYLDASTHCQYASSKWAVRGLLRTLRRVAPAHGTRVNAICPSFLRTALVPQGLLDRLDANAIPLAELGDAGECLLRILCDGAISGRALCVVAKNLVEQAPRGYYDLDMEEQMEGPWFKVFQ